MLEWGFGEKRQTLEASAREAAFSRLRAFSEKLVGREEMLGELVRAACSQRLVTLHGPAGIGKSALARVTAARLSEAGAFPAGVYWLSLRGITHASAVQEAAAATLLTSSDATLLVLDGADRLALAPLAQALLTRFPALQLLVTSHKPTHLPSEVALPLPALTPSDTRRLLVGWASSPLPADATAALARLLEGNPQATRFAATLLETEPLSTLQPRLEEQLTRRILQGAEHDIALLVTRDLLLERLPEASRHLLGAIALFSGGALAEDLAAVWGPRWQEALPPLQRSGLVFVEEGRHQATVELPETPPQAALGPTGLLLALALGHLRAGSTDAAFDLGERALTTARQAANREGFARALLVLGMVTLQEDPARAVLLFEEAATHFENLGDSSAQAEARRWEGLALAQIDEPEAALGALYESYRGQAHPQLEALFAEVQRLLTSRGGGSLLAALSLDASGIREGGLLAARVRLGLPGK